MVFTYFDVTYCRILRQSRAKTKKNMSTNLFHSALKIVEILVESITVQLQADDLLEAIASYSK